MDEREESTTEITEASVTETERDFRLYVPFDEGWTARVKQGWSREYCYAKNPGEDFFHLLLNGELYLVRGAEKYCLNCAMRLGIITADRLNWQHGPKKDRRKPM